MRNRYYRFGLVNIVNPNGFKGVIERVYPHATRAYVESEALRFLGPEWRKSLRVTVIPSDKNRYDYV